jgi:lysophospholipase L1-like esterase
MRIRITISLAATVVALALGAAPASAAPSPPFSQCPPVGADSSCALLIYATSAGQLGVAGDPSQPVYDGVEDTLIGVQNDSSSPISSIPITATTGKDLFAFDGDGLCTYSVPGCPFGPTGYEGPGTSFAVNSPTSGTVNFSPAIAPGGHAYFSLEEALATQPPYDFTPTPAGIGYVALGDSYSAGEGNPPFFSATEMGADTCHRSPLAYPELINADKTLNIASYDFRACSGATRHDLVFGMDTEDSQLDHLSSSTQLVTISVGGNDVGFPDVLPQCVTGLAVNLANAWAFSQGEPTARASADCQNLPGTNPDTGAKTNLDGRENALIADLGKDSTSYCPSPVGYITCSARLASLYYQIAQASARNVRIFVLLYPHLFTTTPPSGGCHNIGVFDANVSAKNIEWLNAGVDRVDNETLSEIKVAKDAGVDVTAVDMRPIFDNGGSASPGGHGVCTKEPWIFGVKLNGTDPAPYSFHPTPTGQTQFAAAMLNAIKNSP